MVKQSFNIKGQINNERNLQQLQQTLPQEAASDDDDSEKQELLAKDYKITSTLVTISLRIATSVAASLQCVPRHR
eukprot:3146855-Amphidinium_carterae.1